MNSNYRGENGKDPGAAISPRPPLTMGPPADDPRNRGNRKQILPASAPVSSLLPPIPAPAQAVHSQILALLNTRQPSAPYQGHQAHQGHHPVMSAHATANAVALPPPPNSHLAPANIHHHCSLAQIEKHVAMLHGLNQTIPQNVALMLAEAKRREEKRNAKRLANRRSASTSRARKKALVKEMTELNARLKRQALILALLPDLVIVIDVEGVITFCSGQVERVLQRKVDDLVGKKMNDILVPSSKGKLTGLIKELTQHIHITVGEESDAVQGKGDDDMKQADEDAMLVEGKELDSKIQASKKSSITKMGTADENALKDAAIVSEAPVQDPSFPLSIVQVKKTAEATTLDENENSDLSASNGAGGSKQMSSLTNSESIPRSPTASSLGNSGSDGDGTAAAAKKKPPKGEGASEASSLGNSGSDGDGAATAEAKKKPVKREGSSKDNKGNKSSSKDLPSSDTSNSSSLSTNAKKLQHANNNLERNVRWHNRKLNKTAKKKYRDDVMGADVIANNASARLSSLRHRMESSSEEDSGYRESNDSREETSSSASDLSDANGRRKPLAPTCNICLVRNDQSTIWCEVTSSIRTSDPEAEVVSSTVDEVKAATEDSQTRSSAATSQQGVVELLLCLRPIRDGETQKETRKVAQKPSPVCTEVTVGTSAGTGTSNEEGETSQVSKKRQSDPPVNAIGPVEKRPKLDH